MVHDVESVANGSAKCQAMGGRLALVADDAERAAIEQYTGNVYVEGTDAAKERTWLTESGEPSYTKFYDNQPNGGTEENCLVLYEGWFHDSACEWKAGYWATKVLCEM